MSTEVLRPLRSMSYNDIKKRRMLREKSRSKLKQSKPENENSQTEKKVYPSARDMFANERPNQIDQAKHIQQVHVPRKKANPVKDTIKRSVGNSLSRADPEKQPITQDSRENCRNGAELKRNVKTTSCEEKSRPCSRSREIVQELIAESKSQRRLLLYKNLRNKYKLSKSRSQSKSSKSLLQKSRILAKRLIQIDGMPQKPADHVLKGIKNSYRIKRFESVQEPPTHINEKETFNAKVELFKGKRKRIDYKIEDQLESSIEIQKRSEVFDETDRFLEEICLRPQKLQHVVQAKSVQVQGHDQILDLLDVEHKEVSKAITKKQRSKKILKDLEKLNRKFPKGFFKF